MKNFRCFSKENLEFSSPIISLIGNNGVGKTSILEAIYLLGGGRSFRTTKSTDVLSWDAEPSKGFYLNTILKTEEGEKSVSLEWKKGKKKYYLNGNKLQSPTDYFGKVPSMVMRPEDIELILGPGSSRRQFVDRSLAIIYPDYLESLISFKKALNARNAVLQSGQKRNQLKIWSEILVECGIVVSKRRYEFAKSIAEEFPKVFGNIFSTAKKRAKCTYKSDYVGKGGVFDKQQLLSTYEKCEDRDFRRKSTGFGPHLDDLFICFFERGFQKDARRFSSRGEARCLALSLALAAKNIIDKELSESLILLLDEPSIDLDKVHVENFFGHLEKTLRSQIIMTSSFREKSLERIFSGVEVFSLDP